MKDNKANQILDQLLENLSTTGLSLEELVGKLKELREHAVAEQDPLLAKVLRLTYEHIEANEGFTITYLEDPEEADTTDLEYLLKLIKDSGNKYNREEISEIRDLLMQHQA